MILNEFNTLKKPKMEQQIKSTKGKLYVVTSLYLLHENKQNNSGTIRVKNLTHIPPDLKRQLNKNANPLTVPSEFSKRYSSWAFSSSDSNGLKANQPTNKEKQH